MTKMSDFTKLYQLSHTLKFELRPIGKTLENLQNSGLLEEDFKRSQDYAEVKSVLDEVHKKFLQDVLSDCDLSWQELADALKIFQINKDRKVLEDVQKKYRKLLADKFNKNEFFKILTEATPSKLFRHLLAQPDITEQKVETFGKFACYFKGYQENRKNIYSAEAQQTAAAYRAVNENFVKYLRVVELYDSFVKNFPELVEDIRQRTAELTDEDLSQVLQVENYNKFVAQSGIEYLNSLIAQINSAVNLYRQAHKVRLSFVPLLFKQILSDREQGFVIERIEKDDDLYEKLKVFCGRHISNVEIRGETGDLFSRLKVLLTTLNDDCDLYVDATSLSAISNALTGNWSCFRDAMDAYANEILKNKGLREKYCKQPVYSFREIKNWGLVKSDDNGNVHPVCLTDYWHGEKALDMFRSEKILRDKVLEMMHVPHDKNFRDRKDDVALVKEYLDAVVEILHLLKPLNVGSENGGDLDLLGTLTEFYEALSPVIPLYNQIRNYVTQKPSDIGKIKLMFNNPTLADGWDFNKEKANTSVIFCRNGMYYLGIMNPKSKTDFDKLATNTSTDCYQKMVYKLLPGPNKMLPKVFFSDKNIDFFAPSEDLLRRYEAKEHLKGEKFDLTFCHELIDFFKESIAKHKDWSKFGFKFSETSAYSGIDEFYREVAEQGYKMSFVNIPVKTVDKLVEDGKLFLFQMWNKDFSEKSTGTPNKFTLYWKALFDRQNLSDVVFKLNGEAELFLREPAITEPIVHRPGEKLVNKTVVMEVDGNHKAIRNSIPDVIYTEIYKYVNGMKKGALSSAAEEYLNKFPRLDWEPGMGLEATVKRTVVKDVKFQLVKDKRFTERKFSFHVPITVNFKSPEPRGAKLNEKVWEFLKDNPDVNVIGIDRGERNLIYVNCIDQKGRILLQRSFNIVSGFDYHQKLDLREKERGQARKSWSEIGTIKELKAGYLSGVVYEIARLMVEYNAIVVMEDLNGGFKRSRTGIEKQIYQKFEKALIDKLNYLVFKNESDWFVPGGLLNGYQLTEHLESFAKLGKQCGWLFYVPAAYTSKIDPSTGFVSLFKLSNYTNTEKRKTFFENFESIIYQAGLDTFVFAFDYKKFKDVESCWKTSWEVYSARSRLVYSRRSRQIEEINPTRLIKRALDQRGVVLSDGFDLKHYITSVEAVNENAAFFKDIFDAFGTTLQMRNSSGEEDYIESPVLNENGQFFDSRKAGEEWPRDADSNGAYHIALKGLLRMKRGQTAKLKRLDWFEFVQRRDFAME